MTEEEIIERILHYLEGAINTYIEGTKVTKVQISVEDDEILLNYISNLQKELDKKDKVIYEACKYINEAKIMNKAIPLYPNKENTSYTVGVASIKEIKQYFYEQVEKVEEENNETN